MSLKVSNSVWVGVVVLFLAGVLREVKAAPACDNYCRVRRTFSICTNGNFLLFSKPDCTYCVHLSPQLTYTGMCVDRGDGGGTCGPTGTVRTIIITSGEIPLCACNVNANPSILFVEASVTTNPPDDEGGSDSWYTCGS